METDKEAQIILIQLDDSYRKCRFCDNYYHYQNTLNTIISSNNTYCLLCDIYLFNDNRDFVLSETEEFCYPPNLIPFRNYKQWYKYYYSRRDICLSNNIYTLI